MFPPKKQGCQQVKHKKTGEDLHPHPIGDQDDFAALLFSLTC
jgi:hypothetical protein